MEQRVRSRRFLSVLLVALTALLVGACSKSPLVPDVPRGPASWMLDIAAACTTSTTDPSGDSVSYQFDWGDGTRSEWSQFMAGGVSYTDTHSYSTLEQFSIKVRAKNSKKASGWSAPLNITVVPGEGIVSWSVGFTAPDDPEDSSGFSLNSFAIGSDNTAYVACEYGALIARKQSGGILRFVLPDPYEFNAAPALADDGTIFIGCTNDTIYILNSDVTVRSRVYAGGPVSATGALASDGTAYFQTEDSMVMALRSDGTSPWTFPSGGGNSAPAVGVDGTVYVTNQDGTVYAIDPSSGSQKWTYNLSSASVQAPALDPSRNMLYVVTDVGVLQSFDVTTGTGGWSYSAGDEASGPAVGPDGSVFVGGGGRLLKLSPEGDSAWTFVPPLAGVLSTPAVTADGYVYVLVVAGKKRLALQAADSLYAVNPDGTRRWACGLGEGYSDADYPLSAPKVDASGLIYVGNGTQAWCVAGVSGPAQSAWPMFQHDARNTGRAQ